MGILGSIGSWVESKAEDAWDGVKDSVNTTEQTVADTVQTAKDSVDTIEHEATDAWDGAKHGLDTIEHEATDAWAGAKHGLDTLEHKATDAWNGAKKAVDTAEHKAADAWDGAKNAVGHKAAEVWDETKQAAGWVEHKAAQAWDWTKDEGARIVDGAIDLAAGAEGAARALVSDVAEGTGHVAFGAAKVVNGHFAEGAKEIGGGLAQATLGGVFDSVALLGAGSISEVQTITHLEQKSRGLSADETKALKAIYGNAVDLSQVRIKEGHAGLLTAADRPWTSGNTIFMNMDKSDPRWTDTLVHEMGHVWQFQNGGGDYQSKSIVAQYVTKDAYQWESAAREEKPWASLNPEDQAELIEQMHRKNFFTTGTFTFTASDGSTVDRTDYAKKVWQEFQKGQGAP